MDWKNFIHSDKNILSGKPVIKGTRISVEFILNLYSQGWSEEDILNEYDHLTRESLRAVFAYLEDCIKNDFLYIKAS
ncbi:MAG: DUF433 domain-containing protein [Bacteroidetes bacterium]|nr:DUF433 domain-containing protein [Bacteroidota bacterium]